MKIATVLGAGMVGSVMACDLAADPGFAVTIADVREESLAAVKRRAEAQGRRLSVLKADLSDPAVVHATVQPASIVLGALSSRIGYAALGAVIDAGKNYCDISFMGEDFTDLDARARSKGVTCLVDFGVAPGMSHALAAHGYAQLDECDSLEIHVGGLPLERRWPFEYKAAFAPSDVIEEYTRPTRLVEHGRVVTRPALSEPELMDFAGCGTLEAFNTDGLRSLSQTLLGKVPFMKEKTLRYPGHIALMRAMRETGLFSAEPLAVRDVDGRTVRIRPLDVTSALMFPLWTYAPGEEDLTVMRVVARGRKSGQSVEHRYDLIDLYDRATGATSMSRTTAFPCAIMARRIARGDFARPGVNPPEAAGLVPGTVDALLAELKARGVNYTYTTGPSPLVL
ncbi:MAG: saccharopine dehydrogenase C-terminal domain-containing protein [Phycisphaerales bacterium]